MDPVSCLYNFLSIGILSYFVIICFLIKKCCMNCGTNCATDENNCKCYQKIYEGEITPSNHVIVCDGNKMLPISYLLDQEPENEGEYVIGNDGVLYRNEACRECCTGDDLSRASCNSHEDVFVIRATRRGDDHCAPCSPSALGLGEGSFKKLAAQQSSQRSSHQSPQRSKGSPSNLSEASELQTIVSPAVDSILQEQMKKIPSERSSQDVEYQKESSQHGGSKVSAALAHGSPTSHTSRTSQGSCGSRKGPGSPTSRTSQGSCGSRKSHGSRSGSPSGRSCTGSASSPRVGSGSPSKKSGSGSCGSAGKPCPSGSGKSSPSLGTKGSKLGEPGSTAESDKGNIGRPSAKGIAFASKVQIEEASMGKDSLAGSSIGGSSVGGASVGGASVGGASVGGASAGGASVGGASVGGASVGGASIGGPSVGGGASIGGQSVTKRVSYSNKFSTKSSCGDIQSESLKHTKSDGSTFIKADSFGSERGLDGECSVAEAKSVGARDTQLIYKPSNIACDGSPTTSQYSTGSKKIPKACTSIGSDIKGSAKAISSSKPQSKSGSCVSPCGTGGSRSVKYSKSSSFKLPCGSPGTPCSFKEGKSAGGLSQKSIGGTSQKSAKGTIQSYGGYGQKSAGGIGRRTTEGISQKYSGASQKTGGGASSARSKNVCSGSVSTKGTAGYSDSTGISVSSYPESPAGKPVSAASEGTGERLPSPILKSVDSPTGRDVITSPRVSIKDKFDIISPEGIRSAPTFKKNECDPSCPSTTTTTSAGASSSNRGTKRKADNISADYKESTDMSRGSKTARFARSKDRYSPKSEYSGYVEDTYGYSPRVDQRCSTGTCSNRNADSKASSKSNKTSKSCSKCSSKGNKSLPTVSTSSAPSSSDIDTTNLSCSKCSSKFSSDTRITSFSSSAKSKPSGTDSLCNPLCQKSKSSSNYQTESVTSADIDDFRTIDPSNSRCENLGVALAQSPCGKILRARESSTCEAIRDPCKDVCCNLGNDPNVECTAIQEMLKNAECPSLIEYIDQINKIGGIDASPKLGHNRNFKSVEDPGKQRSKSAPGGSSAVDAAVIHEISTKVQNCLQHARAIAAKMGSSSQCRKTMRVRAKNLGPSSQDKAETVQVNSRIRLNTKGVAINNFTKVDKPFGRDPGIQVKLMDKQGHVEKFKKPYKDLLSEDASGTINIRICSPCKSTPGKLLCISTNRYPCCTGSPEASTSYKTSGNKVQPQAPDEETSEDDDEYAEPAPRSQDDSQNDGKGAVVVYKRPPKQSQQKKPSGVKGECSTNCGSCQKKSCPTSKYYKGRKKGGGKLQVYNVTTSHFCHNRNSPFIKGINVVDPKMFEQYTHPERHRAGESYMKKRREIIQRIKCKCPWYAHDPSHSNAYKSGNQREPCRKVQFDVDEL